MNEAGSTSEGQPAGYYLRVILRRGWILVICVLLGLGGAYLYSKHQHKEFQATASDAVNMHDPVTNTDVKDPTLYVTTQASLAQDSDVAARAVTCAMRLYGASKSRPLGGSSQDMRCGLYPDSAPDSPTQAEVLAWQKRGRDLFPGGRPWTAKQLLSNSTVAADSSTSLLQFGVTAPTRTLAQWLVNGYAVAFAERSMDQGVAKLTRQKDDLIAQANTVEKTISDLNANPSPGPSRS